MLRKHLEEEVTTLATCWYLRRCDGVKFGFTNHDINIVIDGMQYIAKSGFTASAISGDSSFAVDNLEVSCVIDSNLIKEEEILAGLYDHAEIKVFMVNYNDVTGGTIKLRRGWLGEVRLSKQHFVVEVRGMLQALSSAKLGCSYSPQCRANFGDQKCKINLETYKFCGFAINSVICRAKFRFDFPTTNINTGKIANTDANIDFNHGILTFTDGANKGLSMEIKSCTKKTNNEVVNSGVFVGEVHLALPMPYTVRVGDKFTMIAGCDKNFTTCQTIYNNALNFRGEPHIPNIGTIAVNLR